MAASSTSVTVLTPNGRRQTIKVSPNTPLLQVLEDTCKKHGFNPDDHGLKFQRNVLDLTLQWRFASLPNNAKLEMVPSTRKQAAVDSQVRIGLQMEDGSRLQSSFSCGHNLWELLTHFPETRVLEQSALTPVCVYMRDEVIGEEALKKATLKSLGLTSGSAIVRFLLKKNKTQGEEDGMETVVKPIVPVEKESKPNPSQSPDRPAASPAQSLEVQVPARTGSPERPQDTAAAAAASASTSSSSVAPSQQEGLLDTQDACGPKGTSACVMPVEDEERAGPSRLYSTPAPSPPSAPFIPFSGGGQRLGGPTAGGSGNMLSSSSSSSLVSVVAAGGSPKAKKAKPSHSYNAKGQVNSADQRDEDMENIDEFLEPVEREALIYHLDSGPQRQDNYHELPDEFFEVTVDDIRKRFAQLKSERRTLEETPLMTKALRETQMKEKMERYPKVVLRVQFPDRHVLQGFFRPMETVAAVRKFVKNYLEDPLLNFYLFLTPPKTILDESSATLFQANLFPGALVYFGSDVKTDCFLQREHLNSCVSAMQANESIANCMPSSPPPPFRSVGNEDLPSPIEPAVGTRGVRQDGPDPSAHPQPPQRATPDPGKVPKWLKLPGKK